MIADESILVCCFLLEAGSFIHTEIKMAGKTPLHEENDQDLSSSDAVGSDAAEAVFQQGESMKISSNRLTMRMIVD